MGYLNKATITVDAILTNRGRELLAKGGVGVDQAFNITKFAVADDEVDYGLYNVSHPQGSEYYGNIIENMPVMEATPDEQQIMRYKLVSLKDLGDGFVSQTGEVIIPRIIDALDISINADATAPDKTFQTDPAYQENYTLLISNARLFKLVDGTGLQLNSADKINANGSITISVPYNTRVIFQRNGKIGTTTATVFGDETGATATFTITAS